MQINTQYNQSIMETIKQRKSIRTYDKNAAIAQEIETLKKTTARLGNNMFRFAWVKQKSRSYLAQRIGTYGVIKGAHTFVIGIMHTGAETQKEAAVQFGYEFEQIILKATEMRLGTCWLGGTFNAAVFTKELDLKQNEKIVMVSPVGKPADNKHLISKISSRSANSSTRKAWEELFFDSDKTHSLSKEKAGPYANALEMIRLAPSAVNSQPWRIIYRNDTFRFFASGTSYYALGREQFLRYNDLGIEMAHFTLTCQELDLNGRWDFDMVFNDSGKQWDYIRSWVKEK